MAYQKKNWYNTGEPEANDNNSVANKENMNDLENRIENAFNILEVKDFESQVSFSESPGSFIQFKKVGNIIIILYQGQNKTHNNRDILFNIPEEYAPKNLSLTVPFTKNSVAYGEIIIRPSGEFAVNYISSASVSGRIVFSVAYAI